MTPSDNGSFFKGHQTAFHKLGSNPYSKANFNKNLLSGQHGKGKFSLTTEVNVNLNRPKAKAYGDGFFNPNNESISLNVSFQTGDLDYKSIHFLKIFLSRIFKVSSPKKNYFLILFLFLNSYLWLVIY